MNGNRLLHPTFGKRKEGVFFTALSRTKRKKRFHVALVFPATSKKRKRKRKGWAAPVPGGPQGDGQGEPGVGINGDEDACSCSAPLKGEEEGERGRKKVAPHGVGCGQERKDRVPPWLIIF